MCDLEEKDISYAKLDSALDQYPSSNTFVLLEVINLTTSTGRINYKLCIGTNGFEIL